MLVKPPALLVSGYVADCIPAVNLGGLAHPLRHPAEAAPPFAVFEGWELGISGAKLLQKDRLIRVQGTRDHLFDLGSMEETCANSCQASCAPRFWLSC